MIDKGQILNLIYDQGLKAIMEDRKLFVISIDMNFDAEVWTYCLKP